MIAAHKEYERAKTKDAKVFKKETGRNGVLIDYISD